MLTTNCHHFALPDVVAHFHEAREELPLRGSGPDSMSGNASRRAAAPAPRAKRKIQKNRARGPASSVNQNKQTTLNGLFSLTIGVFT